MTWRGAAVVLAVALGLAASSNVTSAETQAPCAPTVTHLGPVPADQDIRFGQCLFNSTIAFNQANPNNAFASCNGCHPGGGTDRGTHPVMITNSLGTFIGVRQVPNLRNVQFNVPLGWDGRHGGVLGDVASIKQAIHSAASGAINSPVEMAGHIDPANNPADKAKLDALTAFLISRSPTAPPPPNPSEPPPQPPTLDPQTLANIAIGANVFFGRAASTAPLLAAGKACVSCHTLPFFTDNQVRTNILNPDAAFDFGFPQRGGGTGPQDRGAGFTTVTDPTTGRSVRVGTFKTPSLHRFYPDGEPAFHSGIFDEDGRVFRFYQKSLGFTLAPGESTGLHYWIVNCPRGPQRPPSAIPPECN